MMTPENNSALWLMFVLKRSIEITGSLGALAWLVSLGYKIATIPSFVLLIIWMLLYAVGVIVSFQLAYEPDTYHDEPIYNTVEILILDPLTDLT